MRMKTIFLRDLEQSVLLKDLKKRMRNNFLVRLWESVTRMLSPLF